MRLKELFGVPKGQRITDKYLYRVLFSYICSILLCMGCLAGTTWAWFTVSIENIENVIQIGTPEVNVTVNDAAFTSGSKLTESPYKVEISHANEVDSLSQKSTLYVTLIINEEGDGEEVQEHTILGYTVLNYQNNYQTEITIESEKVFELSWEVSWFVPANGNLLIGDTITVKETPEAPTVSGNEIPTEVLESADSEETESTPTVSGGDSCLF